MSLPTSVTEKLKSRKLWFSILSIIASAVYPPLIPVIKLLAPVYVGGQALVDAADAFSSK